MVVVGWDNVAALFICCTLSTSSKKLQNFLLLFIYLLKQELAFHFLNDKIGMFFFFFFYLFFKFGFVISNHLDK